MEYGCKLSAGLALRLATPDTRRPAEEFLHFALVAIWRLAALAQWLEPPGGREGLDRLARREAEAVARLLEAAVVQAAPVAQLLPHFFGNSYARRAREAGGDRRSPRREQRRVRLAQ